jgi:asparagine synthase (glutamine-hydrolysing)
MCGICGVIGGDRNEVEPAVRRMMAAMVHRGPDDEGYEELELGDGDQGPVAGFGFRRLAILDLTAAGHQPMFNSATGDCLIFNGEIYNFKSLRAELQLRGILFRGTSDSEVLLQALSTWGEAALEKLQGMYAFAFYEAKTRRVLLARDPLGIKPLYYAALHDRLLFASEVRALLASGVVRHDLDIAGITGMLAYGAPQDPLTVHREIRSLPAGHLAWVGLGSDGYISGLDARRFWRFPAESSMSLSSETAAAAVRGLLETAVTRHLVADRPVGVFLSAGLDSFAIAALAKLVRGDIKTFTVGFNEPGLVDEVEEAERAAKTLGTDHQRVILGSCDVAPLWNGWLATADRPSVDGFNTFVVSHAVKLAGKTVALSGLGGDEIFGGYPTFAMAKRYASLLRVVGTLPRSIRTLGVRLLLQRRSRTFREKAKELAVGGGRLDAVALRLRRILTDRQIRRLGIDPSSLPLDEHLLFPSVLAELGDDGVEAFNRVARLECGLYMRNTLLRDTDAVSMAHSLEVRVPLLDQPLVDYVMGLPERFKAQSRSPAKMLLRSAMKGLVPDAMLHRPKTGFCLPIDRWMHGPLRDSCQAAIDSLADAGILDAREVRAQWKEFLGSSANVHWIRPMAFIALGSYLRNVSGRG